MRKGDIILLVTVICLGITGCILIGVSRRETGYVTVMVAGNEIGTYSLSEDKEVMIETENGGRNVLRIRSGRVKILSANCPNQDCVHHKEIMYSNESIVCLPHKITVIIHDNTGENATDAVVY